MYLQDRRPGAHDAVSGRLRAPVLAEAAPPHVRRAGRLRAGAGQAHTGGRFHARPLRVPRHAGCHWTGQFI